MTTTRLAGPQGSLNIDDAGSGGFPVLFVHCDCGNLTQWREALDHLRTRRRAVAFDLRGHGASAAAADGDYSFAGRADDIAAVIDGLSLGAVRLVAHSGGALAALHFAAANAPRVAALLLVDPATDGRQFPAEQRDHFVAQLRSPRYRDVLRDYYGSIAGECGAVRDRVLRDADGTPQATVLATFTALTSYDPTPALAGYQGRRLSLVTPVTDTPAALHRASPDLPYRKVAVTGHWPHLEDPRTFHDVLDEFLEEG
jgi:pimeloyl-ACP methyl ester carboxylesterase